MRWRFWSTAAASAQTRALAGAEMAQQGKQFLPGCWRGRRFRTFPEPRQRAPPCLLVFPAKIRARLYAGTPADPVVFDRAGVVALGCNIHDRMVGWIVVVDTPYYAQAAEAPRRSVTACRPATQARRLAPPHGTGRCPAHQRTVAVPATGNVRAAASW